jgi:hypothetical protein
MNKIAIKYVNFLLCQIIRSDIPFNNKIFLVLDNFRQVTPVLRDITAPTTIFENSIRLFSLWKYFVILRLIQSIRNTADPEYI